MFSRAQSYVFSPLSTAYSFATGYVFSRVCHGSHVSPRFLRETFTPVLHACHGVHIFPRLHGFHVFSPLKLVTFFVVTTGRMFSASAAVSRFVGLRLVTLSPRAWRFRFSFEGALRELMTSHVYYGTLPRQKLTLFLKTSKIINNLQSIARQVAPSKQGLPLKFRINHWAFSFQVLIKPYTQ